MARQSGSPLNDPATVFRVCELFFEGSSAAQIAKKLGEELRRHVTREQIYPLLRKAGEPEGFLSLVPPLDRTLAEELRRHYPVGPEGTITVVDTRTPFGTHSDHVVRAAAGVAMDRIREVQKAKGPGEPVHVGLGPGGATLLFSKELSKLLQDPYAPKLRLYAITAGVFNNGSPEYAPLAFFNVFPDQAIESCVALFAATTVRCEDLPRVKKQPSVEYAFNRRKDVDIIVTSMGDITDDHDLYSRYLERIEPGSVEDLKRRGCIGNIQYRPFTATGPLEERKADWRAVTLFELEDLRQMAKQKGKHVILMARPRSQPDGSVMTVPALRHLMEIEELRVWSDLVTHVNVAKGLLPHGAGSASDQSK